MVALGKKVYLSLFYGSNILLLNIDHQTTNVPVFHFTNLVTLFYQQLELNVFQWIPGTIVVFFPQFQG